MKRNFERKIDPLRYDPYSVSNVRFDKTVWIDDSELAKRLKKTAKTIGRMVDEGRLPPHAMVGGKRVWRLNEIVLWEKRGQPKIDEFRRMQEESIRVNVIGSSKSPTGLAKEWEDRLN